VQGIVKEMKTQLEDAFRGVQPTFTAVLPDFFTAEFTFKLATTMLEANKLIVRAMINKLQAEGIRPSNTDPRFAKATEDIDAAFALAKEQIFENNGLNELDEPAALLYNTAVQKYSAESPWFAKRYEQAEMDYKMELQRIFSSQR
jgi:hypothetical protein